MSSTPEHRSELRLKARTTLDNLEVKDLCNQAFTGLQRICDRCSTPADLCLVLKETLSGLSCANTQARRFRYKAAGLAVAQRAAEWVGPSVPSLVKHVLDRIGQEEQQSNQEELAGLLKALAVAAVAYNAGRETQQKDDNWFGRLLTEPLLKTAASGPSKQRVANGCMMVHAVLTAVLEWANYQPVISASVDCLKIMLHNLNSGLLTPRVPEVFLPLKQCIEILGAGLRPKNAQAILDQCLQGIAQKEDWQMRRQAVETFITLAAAVQVHKPSEAGQWQLEHTPCIEVLVRSKAAILNALTDAKYDKITHVRQAVGKALAEMDCIPSPRAKSRIPTALSGDDSDLETLLASKRAKPDSRSWSGASAETEGAGSDGDALGDAYADGEAPSPRSDMGTAFDPEQDPGDSPRTNSCRGREVQPLRASLQSKQGSRRRGTADASANSNRTFTGSRGSSRTPLGHVTDSARPVKSLSASAGAAARQRKENLTPSRPRQSFTKPRKQVFADFGVQVFAPLPRAISPERELPKPATLAEGDDSPVGPLKLRLPDLTQPSAQDRATVVLEDADSEVAAQQQAPDQSVEKAVDEAPVHREAHQGPEHPALQQGPKHGSEQGSAQAQQSESMKTTGDRLPAQQHTVRVEAGPDVHMDKAAGIINILGLPLGCSVRLLGLHHSLYEHAVRVEITAPSDRGTDHFSYSLGTDKASHQALHEAQRQAGSAPEEQPFSPDPAVQSTTADAGAVTQSGSTALRSGAAHVEQPQQQQLQSPGLPPQEPASSQPAANVSSTHTHGTQGSQQQSSSPEHYLGSGSGMPSSMNMHDSQQQLLQQLAAQAGFHLVPPPSQPPVSTQAVMQAADQHTPLPGSFTYQQQQLQSPLLGQATATQGLNQELSHGLLQQLGQGLQTSAMQFASMQQQQQQSRLPAWAQQALLPEQVPLGAASPYYGVQGLSPGHSMHALHSPPVHGITPASQYGDGTHMREQLDAAMQASQSGGSWQVPAWPQQQQPIQDTLQGSMHWLSQHAQQLDSSTAAGHSGQYSAVQGSRQHQMQSGQFPLDVAGNLAAASWAQGGFGGPDVGPDTQMPQLPLMQQQASNADSMHSHSPGAWQHSSQAGVKPSTLNDELRDCDADQRFPLNAQRSTQADTGALHNLNGGSSDLSSPLRGSGHLENLMEVNARVEAAMDRAQAQLQDGVQRAKPRGLSNSVERTVRNIARSAAPQPGRAVRAAPVSSHDDTASRDDSDSMQESTAEERGQSPYTSDARKDAALVMKPKSGAFDSAEEDAGPYGRSPVDSPPQGPWSRGRPPLSPVKQSVQDLSASRESISIDPMTGMPKQDINVHCNPLFTEPMAVHHSSSVQKHAASGSVASRQISEGASDQGLVGSEGIGQQRAVPASPPSKLQQSLRALLQQHAERMEVVAT